MLFYLFVAAPFLIRIKYLFEVLQKAVERWKNVFFVFFLFCLAINSNNLRIFAALKELIYE